MQQFLIKKNPSKIVWSEGNRYPLYIFTERENYDKLISRLPSLKKLRRE